MGFFFFAVVNLRWHLLILSQQILIVQKIHFKSFYIKTFKIKIYIWRSRHCAPTAVNSIIRQHTISYKSPNEKNTTSSMKKSCTPQKKLNLDPIYYLDSISNLQEYREQRSILNYTMGIQPPKARLGKTL